MDRPSFIRPMIIGVSTLSAASISQAGVGQKAPQVMTSELHIIEQMVQQVREDRSIDRAKIEKLIGAKLAQTEQNTNYLTYASDETKAAGSHLSAELRAPNRSGDPSSGSLLVIRLHAGCLPKSDIEKRYAPWTIGNVPRGGSIDEETSWVRHEPWGKLSFGFAERAPDCLSSVVFDSKG